MEKMESNVNAGAINGFARCLSLIEEHELNDILMR